jgi:hypothetical protein
MSTSLDSGKPTVHDSWPYEEVILYQLEPGGKFLTWEQMRAARVDKLMPRQPKPDWRRK